VTHPFFSFQDLVLHYLALSSFILIFSPSCSRRQALNAADESVKAAQKAVEEGKKMAEEAAAKAKAEVLPAIRLRFLCL
jgi:hypothetical protein